MNTSLIGIARVEQLADHRNVHPYSATPEIRDWLEDQRRAKTAASKPITHNNCVVFLCHFFPVCRQNYPCEYKNRSYSKGNVD
jgi:hypothetical protein